MPAVGQEVRPLNGLIVFAPKARADFLHTCPQISVPFHQMVGEVISMLILESYEDLRVQ